MILFTIIEHFPDPFPACFLFAESHGEAVVGENGVESCVPDFVQLPGELGVAVNSDRQKTPAVDYGISLFVDPAGCRGLWRREFSDG